MALLLDSIKLNQMNMNQVESLPAEIGKFCLPPADLGELGRNPVSAGCERLPACRSCMCNSPSCIQWDWLVRSCLTNRKQRSVGACKDPEWLG